MKRNRAKDRRFSSGFEETFSEYLRKLGIDYDYEKVRVPFEVPAYIAHYTPDFVFDKKSRRRLKRPLKLDPKRHIILETKGKFPMRDRNKMIWVKKMNPDLDIRMIFMDDRVIDKRKKGRRDGEEGLRTKGYRHSDWCIDHGFPYYIGGEPPKEWFK